MTLAEQEPVNRLTPEPRRFPPRIRSALFPGVPPISTDVKSQIEVNPKIEAEQTQRYALLSVSNKAGIAEFATTLESVGYRIISTGGTAKTLRDAEISVVPIEDVTGNPESFDGRMKTISFQVGSGILYDRSNPSHVQQAEDLQVKSIDVVVCNLYPFENTVGDPNVSMDSAIESIDVGGPTMLRAAAKNHKNVLAVVDPADYKTVSEALASGKVTDELRQQLAAKVFGHLSFYDAQIARHLSKEPFPQELALPGRKAFQLRYGENPHQEAVVYFEPNTNSPLRHLERHTGRELSYVNFTDIAAGLESVRMFAEPSAVVIKHNNPSGIALGETPAEALRRAVAADPESAFGGVIVLNKPLDLKTAQTFAEFKEEDGVLIDIVAAPGMSNEARDAIRKTRKSTGIYTFGDIPNVRSNANHVRFFDGGYTVQPWDDVEPDLEKWEVVTRMQPTEQQLSQMETAWRFIRRIKSNTVLVMDKDLPMTRGIGAGQTSRVRSTRIALEQAGDHAEGAILASDSFFPFDDSVKLAAKRSISAIIQQGGSRNDLASIDAADKAGIVMVMTGERKFWH